MHHGGNMAEIEIGILDRQCLNRRIPTEEKLKQEIGAWEARRNTRAKTMTYDRKLFAIVCPHAPTRLLFV